MKTLIQKPLTRKQAWMKIAKAFREPPNSFTGTGLCHAVGWLRMDGQITMKTTEVMERQLARCSIALGLGPKDYYFWPIRDNQGCSIGSYRRARALTAEMLAKRFSKKELLKINKGETDNR